MHALADQGARRRSAARPVCLAVRARMGLLAVLPEHLRQPSLDDRAPSGWPARRPSSRRRGHRLDLASGRAWRSCWRARRRRSLHGAPAAWKLALPSPNQPVSGFSTTACTPGRGRPRRSAHACGARTDVTTSTAPAGPRARQSAPSRAARQSAGRWPPSREHADEVDISAVDRPMPS